MDDRAGGRQPIDAHIKEAADDQPEYESNPFHNRSFINGLDRGRFFA
jgi:hypothetical protein